MSFPAEILPFAGLALLLSGWMFRSRMLVGVSALILPGVTMAALFGADLVFGSPAITVYLAAASLCLAGLALTLLGRLVLDPERRRVQERLNADQGEGA